MTSARRRVSEVASRTPVTRWVSRVFLGTSLLGLLVGLGVFAILFREAEHGHVTAGTAVLLFLIAYVVVAAVGVWLFLRIGLPPVTVQAHQLDTALAHQTEVNRRQHDFLAHVHHELRTPVTVVLGATQTLHAHGDELSCQSQVELREAAFRHAQSLSEVVSSLTVGVDDALPGLALEDVDSWSSALGTRQGMTSASTN